MEEKLNELFRRVEELERFGDYNIFTAYMGHLDRPDVYRCIEIAVAEYFDIPFSVFYNLLAVGNRKGMKGRNIPLDPDKFHDEEDKIIIARYCLYAILHIDFHIPIRNLCHSYNNNVANYIREWKQRYIRLTESNVTKRNIHDASYLKYWNGIYKKGIEVAHRYGLYDKLVEKLVNDGQTPEKLVKWRISQ